MGEMGDLIKIAQETGFAQGMAKRVPEIKAFLQRKDRLVKELKGKEEKIVLAPGLECALALQNIIDARAVAATAAGLPAEFAAVTAEAVGSKGVEKVRDELIKGIREKGPGQMDLFIKAGEAIAAATALGISTKDAVRALSYRG